MEIESMLSQVVSRYNRGKQSNKYSGGNHDENQVQSSAIETDTIKLANYKRQYFCGIDAAGDKILYVNCFCGDFPGWRNNVIMVDDGGICFFQVEINLTQQTVYNFRVNGIA